MRMSGVSKMDADVGKKTTQWRTSSTHFLSKVGANVNVNVNVNVKASASTPMKPHAKANPNPNARPNANRHSFLSFPFVTFPFLSFPFVSFPFVSFPFVSFPFVSFQATSTATHIVPAHFLCFVSFRFFLSCCSFSIGRLFCVWFLQF